MIKRGDVFVVKRTLAVIQIDAISAEGCLLYLYENYNAYSAGEILKACYLTENNLKYEIEKDNYIPVDAWLETLNHKIITA